MSLVRKDQSFSWEADWEDSPWVASDEKECKAGNESGLGPLENPQCTSGYETLEGKTVILF